MHYAFDKLKSATSTGSTGVRSTHMDLGSAAEGASDDAELRIVEPKGLRFRIREDALLRIGSSDGRQQSSRPEDIRGCTQQLSRARGAVGSEQFSSRETLWTESHANFSQSDEFVGAVAWSYEQPLANRTALVRNPASAPSGEGPLLVDEAFMRPRKNTLAGALRPHDGSNLPQHLLKPHATAVETTRRDPAHATLADVSPASARGPGAESGTQAGLSGRQDVLNAGLPALDPSLVPRIVHGRSVQRPQDTLGLDMQLSDRPSTGSTLRGPALSDPAADTPTSMSVFARALGRGPGRRLPKKFNLTNITPRMALHAQRTVR